MSVSRGGRTVASRVLAGLVVLLLLFFLFQGGSDAGNGPSAASTEKQGRRAAFLLLEQLGFEPELWRGVPADLPRGPHMLILPAAPPVPLGLADEGTPPLSARSPDAQPGAPNQPRDPHFYARFLEEGGTIVAGWDDVEQTELALRLGLTELERLPLELGERGSAGKLLLRGGDEVRVQRSARRVFEGVPPHGVNEHVDVVGGLREDFAEQPVVLELSVGRGRLVLLPTLAFSSNARLGELQHSLLLVRLVEEFLRDGRLLFDEYALGSWRADTTLDVLFSPTLIVFSLQVLLLAAIALWRLVWVREFPRDPVPVAGLAPATRAKALGSFLLRARRTALLGRMLRNGVLRRLAARVSLRGDAYSFPSDAEPDPDLAREVLERFAAALPPDADTAGGFGGATSLEPLRAGWERVVLGSEVAGPAGLEQLARELGAIERTVPGSGATPLDPGATRSVTTAVRTRRIRA